MDQRSHISPPQNLDGPLAWSAADVSPETITLTVSDAAVDELMGFVAHWRTHYLPTIVLDPADYALDACRAIAAQVRAMVFEGVGLCVVDRLPMERLTAEEAKACYWLLASMVCRPVAQKMDGTLIYDVHDTGAKAAAGSGVRPDKTNADLTFHNDNAYNAQMPEIVALLCIRPAKAGGVSRVMSFETAHNLLVAREPDVLPRLYRPFYFDRQREHAPDDSPLFAAPIFETDGESVEARLGLHQLKNAYEMSGETLDEDGQKAISALEKVFADDAHQMTFSMAAGQIQFVNNRAIGHSRTAFEDFDDVDRRRHLVRLWLRDAGDRSYVG